MIENITALKTENELGIAPNELFETTRDVLLTYDWEVSYFTDEFLKSKYARINDTQRFLHHMFSSLNARIDLTNALVTTKEQRWMLYGKQGLQDYLITKILLARHHVVRIKTAAKVQAAGLAIYCDDQLADPSDPRYGTYQYDEDMIGRAARLYEPTIGVNRIRNIMMMLRTDAPLVNACDDKDICVFKNGILNRRTKTMEPFSPKYIVTSKANVNYNPNAVAPKITMKNGETWTPEQFLPSLTSDPAIAKLLLEGIAAMLRPLQDWQKMFWLYSVTGNNGKGTYCELLRNIAGEDSCASINMPDMAKEFRLNGIQNSIAIIADENPVGIYIDDSHTLKNLVTGDPVNINIKYKNPMDYRFRGFVVQCINELPQIRDRSGSLARRVILIEFDQNFEGRVIPEIKQEYLKRQDVLEWFVKIAMDLDFDNFDIPEKCKASMLDYLEYNDPVREFVNEIMPQYTWDLIPTTLIFEQYVSWMKQNYPMSTPMGRNKFLHHMGEVLNETKEWYYPTDRVLFSSEGRMVGPERTIVTYKAESWINDFAKLNDINGQCTPAHIARQYRGILRINSDKNLDKSSPNYDTLLAESKPKSTTPTDYESMLSLIDMPNGTISEALTQDKYILKTLT